MTTSSTPVFWGADNRYSAYASYPVGGGVASRERGEPASLPAIVRQSRNLVRATLEAVRIVRPALEKFYASLSDEQQARFNALPPNVGEAPQQEANAPSEACGDPKSSLTQLPIERIEAVTHPTGKQKHALECLSGATRDAVKTLQAACPDSAPLTPVDRWRRWRSGLAPCCRPPTACSRRWTSSTPR
jgi:hypothetical protein